MTTFNDVARARRDGTVLGIPLGELGFLQTLLFSAATGFAAFFLTTFFGIVWLLVYTTSTGRPVDYSLAYKHAGFPVGLVVLAIALGFLGTVWIRHKARG